MTEKGNGTPLPRLRAVLTAQPLAWLFFGSFIVIAVFVVINLFIAVVINNLERAKAAEEVSRDAAHPQRDVLAGIAALQEQLARLEHQLREAP
jgi:voltage-gated sodium channel